MWLATFVDNTNKEQNFHNICCAENSDELLKYVLEYKYTNNLTEWQQVYKATSDKSINIKDINGGLRIIFKNNIYMDLKDITLINKIEKDGKKDIKENDKKEDKEDLKVLTL